MRVAISISLMGWLIRTIDFGEVTSHWREVNWVIIVLFIPAFYLFNVSIRSVRLQLIIRLRSLDISYWWLWLVQLKSSFVVSFVPGGMAGDIYRTYVIGKEWQDTLNSIMSVLTEKIIGLASMMALSVISLLYGIYWLQSETFDTIAPAIFLFSTIFFAGCLVVMLMIRLRLLDRWQFSISWWRRLQEEASQLSTLFSSGTNLLKLVILSTVLQVSIVLWYFTIARAMQLQVSLVTFLIIVPLVELLVTLPISVGGLGVRDSALAVLLIPFGLSGAEALSFSLLVTFTGAMVHALSGIAFLFQTESQSGLVPMNLHEPSKVM